MSLKFAIAGQIMENLNNETLQKLKDITSSAIECYKNAFGKEYSPISQDDHQQNNGMARNVNGMLANNDSYVIKGN